MHEQHPASSQIENTIGSISIRNQCIIDVDPMVFAIWVDNSLLLLRGTHVPNLAREDEISFVFHQFKVCQEYKR